MANKLANIVGSGYPGQAANYISGTAIDALTATGSTQGTALAITADTNVVTTAAAGTGVVFSGPTTPGDEFIVANLGANALAVYPASGESIMAGATNAAFSVAAGKAALFIKTSATRWIAILSA